MARPTKEEQHAAIHAEAIAEFDRIQRATGGERLQALQDRRFYSISGAQWEGALGDQFENKPRFEFNKLHLAVIRVVNEYRNNRITVDFLPKDGTNDDQLADTCDGLYRADEKSCTADEAYDNAFEEGVAGGMGAWRLRACYEDDEDEEDERQRVRIEPIFDADSTVFFDLDAKRQDKSDAKRCYVLTAYTPEIYIEEWNDDPASWPRDTGQTEFDWHTPDVVWVCEMYKVVEKSETIRVFRPMLLQDESTQDLRISQEDLDAEPGKLDELLATGFQEVRTKKVKRRRVHKYILSGGRVLEDCGLIPGRHIPIVPFYGKRWVVDGSERFMGHVRLAKDAQRLTNMLMSWLAEMAARFDIEKPIFTQEQVAGHATMWAEDNIKKYPYLLINPTTDESGQRIPAGPIAYTRAPNMPPAMAALAQLAEQALQDLLGNQDRGEQLQPNMSGKAVELVQQRLDMQVFIYMSNLAKSMKRSGEVWLAMMKDIVVEQERKMKVINSNGETGSVVMNRATFDQKTGDDTIENDLTRASFEVDVDVGPSSSSRRAGIVRALTGMMQLSQDPATIRVLTGASMMNMEGEGLDDVRKYFRRQMVRDGVVKPTEEELQELQAEAQNEQPNAQDQYLLAAAEQAKADAIQKRAKAVESVAGADLKKAQTAESLAKAAGEENAQQIASVNTLRDLLTPPQQPGIA